ncbi:MAG: ribonucleoside-triphosphate reductase [Candidatus Muirbacterium halophilum]|nr:ribonucleoside-triphosphate reductase [Candidatus Muirbacterium halophilum]
MKINTYQELIYKLKYARWKDNENRRENWDETIDRYKNFLQKFIPKEEENMNKEFLEAIECKRNMGVMGSMRALWASGPALEKENVCGYNCAYTTIDTIRSFSEVLYILMCGTGVGFSVERQYINKLPEIPEDLVFVNDTVKFSDSRKGWAEGFHKYLSSFYKGIVLNYDLSLIREKGSRLKTFGGRSAGPRPLKELLEYTKNLFLNASSRKLTSIECHDLVCMIAGVVVSGGIRRSACISLSNLSDMRMRHCKDGEFYLIHPHRSYSNNSAVYVDKPDTVIFLEEMISLIKSNTGERGIINRTALKNTVPERRNKEYDFGLNPCGEIILRPRQFCNLTEVIIRPDDTPERLLEKVRYATILGVLQSNLTNFQFLSSDWKKNCEEERLLGVSLTGLMDHPVLNKVDKKAVQMLELMKNEAIKTSERWAKSLNINAPKAVTAVKPSGTVSQLVDSASGLHARYSSYYIRRVRVSTSDPMFKFLVSKNIPWNPEVGQSEDTMTTAVFDFIQKSPKTSVIRTEKNVLEQLDYWKMLKNHWCEHNPSCTIYVKEDEWPDVIAWTYKNWDILGGISFLPFSDTVYRLAPYEPISEEEYNKRLADYNNIDFEELDKIESEDNTTGSREFACTGNKCEL